MKKVTLSILLGAALILAAVGDLEKAVVAVGECVGDVVGGVVAFGPYFDGNG